MGDGVDCDEMVEDLFADLVKLVQLWPRELIKKEVAHTLHMNRRGSS